MIQVLAIVAVVVTLVFVIRRAVKRAEREADERNKRKWNKPEPDPGPLETLLKDTRPQWRGEKEGES